MLRLAGPGDFASLCAIWRAGFGDGEEYVRLFWQNWRESCRPYLWQDEAGPAAALFLLPVEYRRGSERVPLWYLYAAATLPQRQGEGIMSRMLEEVYRRETGGRAGIVLVPGEPSLFSFYGSRGYREWGGLRRLTVARGECTGAGCPLPPLSPEALADRREAAFLAGGYLAHGPAGLRHAVADCRFWGGDALGFAGGHLLYQRDGEELVVKELAAPDDGSARAALAALFAQTGAARARLALPVYSPLFAGRGEVGRFAQLRPAPSAPDWLLGAKTESCYAGLLYD